MKLVINQWLAGTRIPAGYYTLQFMKGKAFIYILLWFTVCSATSQEVWTLQDCIETGKKNNPDFQLRQLEILSAETTHRSPIMEYLPKVDFSASQSYSVGSTIDPATNNRISSSIQSDNFALNAGITLLDFNVFTTARRNKIAVLKAAADKEATAAEYCLSILENYFNVLYTQELLKIQQNQFENATFNLNRIEKEVTLGSKPNSDLYDIKVSYSQEENNILETKQLLYSQKLTLLQLLNVEDIDPDDILLAEVEEKIVTEKIETSVFENTVKNYPSIRAANLAIEMSKKDVTIQKNKYLPSLDAFYSYSSFYYLPLNQASGQQVNPFWTQINDNKNHYIGFQVNVPIFNGLRTSRDVQLAKIEYKKRQVESEKEKIKLRQTIEQEEAKKRQNMILINQLEDTRRYAEKSFTTTQAKFSSGLVEAIVFTTSKNQMLMAQYNLLKAQYTVQYIKYKLQFLQFNTF
ncbi:TolC family protein [Flavobacterium rhizosphaerae]|uniref:TolC family protein n=1 Tax=Flavobacterium rhizosphaerae TaxID=3163298 RepID=A0ABW8YWT0_9FLAO